MFNERLMVDKLYNFKNNCLPGPFITSGKSKPNQRFQIPEGKMRTNLQIANIKKVSEEMCMFSH